MGTLRITSVFSALSDVEALHIGHKFGRYKKLI